MFTVEITYITKLGPIRAAMTTSQKVGSREDALLVIEALRANPLLGNAKIVLKNSPPQTADEALEDFAKALARHEPVEG